MSAPLFDFDPDLVSIERKRRSTTQGSVIVSYDGIELGHYGDDIHLIKEGIHRGEYHGHEDAYWMAVAQRQAIAQGLVCDDDENKCSECRCTYEDGGDGFNGMCPSCADAAEEQTFKINVAMNIRAYGVVEVKAATIDDAQELLTHEYIGQNFEPHGNGSDDYDMNHPEQVSLTEWEDENGGAGELHVELPDPAEVVLMAVGLHGVTRADLALIGDMRHDTDGNPCVWTNRYSCTCGMNWNDQWSCQCDDTCPGCGKDVSPHTSEFDTSIPEPLQRLWEMLPEAR